MDCFADHVRSRGTIIIVLFVKRCRVWAFPLRLVCFILSVCVVCYLYSARKCLRYFRGAARGPETVLGSRCRSNPEGCRWDSAEAALGRRPRQKHQTGNTEARKYLSSHHKTTTCLYHLISFPSPRPIYTKQ